MERSDFQIKIRGYRVECGEVESALNRVSGVKHSVVVAREDSRGEKLLVAYFVPEKGCNLEARAMRFELARRLPDYMVPESIVPLDVLPLGATGKVDRGALPDPGLLIAVSERKADVPSSLIEFELAKIWARILDRESVGRYDNFFELGGHSLLATRMVAEADRLLNCRFPIAVLFQAPTVELLAQRLIDEDWAPAWSSLVPLKTSGSQLPLFLVHGWGGTVFSYLELVQQLPDEQPCYGIQAVGLDGKEVRHTSVEQMAAHYVDEICSFQPEGPISLAGYSMGGLIAFELAQQLLRKGREVAFLGIIDTGFMSGVPWQAYIMRVGSYLPCRMVDHVNSWLRLPLREKGPYIAGRWKALSHWMGSYWSRGPVVEIAKKGAVAPKIPGYDDYFHAVAASYRTLPYLSLIHI